MKRRREVPLAVRDAVISAWKRRDEEPVSLAKLGARFNLAKSTVSTMVRRFNKTGSIANAPGRGPSKALSSREREILAQMAREDPSKGWGRLAKAIGEVTGKKISATTVSNYLKGGRGKGEEVLEETNNSKDADEPGPSSPLSSFGDDDGVKGEEESEQCFLCSSKFSQDNRHLIDEEGIVQFVMRRLLDIPEGRWTREEEAKLCPDCRGEVSKGRDILKQLEDAAKQFRAVQKKLVERIRKAPEEQDGRGRRWRQFVKTHEYQWDGALVIGGEGRIILEGTVKTEVESENDADEDDGDGGDFFGGDRNHSDGDSGGDEEDEIEERKFVACTEAVTSSNAIERDTGSSSHNLRRSSRQLKPTRSEVTQRSLLKKRKKGKRDRDDLSTGKWRGRISCEMCGESVKSANISDHVLNHVGEEYMTKCPNSSCPLVFTNSFARRRHVFENSCRMGAGTLTSVLNRIGETEYAYLCQECGVACSDIVDLQAHLAGSHKGAPKNLKCPVTGCQERFAGAHQSVHIHLLQKHDFIGKALSLQKCPNCSERLWVEDMEAHLRSNHDAQEITKCSRQCPHLFPNREDLIEHLHKVHAQDGKPFSCDICSSDAGSNVPLEDLEIYDNHLQLREHYFKEHQVGKRFECQLCPDRKAYWAEKSLQAHLQKTHVNASQRFTCDICENGQSPSFPNQSQLQGHKIREHGLKPFLCDMCGVGFGVKQLLQRHKLIHTGERPFVCPQCGQQFRQSEVLGRHLKAHALKGDRFKAKGPMKQIRKRVTPTQ